MWSIPLPLRWPLVNAVPRRVMYTSPLSIVFFRATEIIPSSSKGIFRMLFRFLRQSILKVPRPSFIFSVSWRSPIRIILHSPNFFFNSFILLLVLRSSFFLSLKLSEFASVAFEPL